MKSASQLFYIVLAFVLCGCSVATQIPATSWQQMSSADLIVITNRAYAVGATITGTNLSSLITAIKSSKAKKLGAGLDWGSPSVCTLEFYAGTNHLTSFPTEHGVFNLDGVEYFDSLGVLEAFCRNIAGDNSR
jgi:hypothetical protein